MQKNKERRADTNAALSSEREKLKARLEKERVDAVARFKEGNRDKVAAYKGALRSRRAGAAPSGDNEVDAAKVVEGMAMLVRSIVRDVNPTSGQRVATSRLAVPVLNEPLPSEGADAYAWVNDLVEGSDTEALAMKRLAEERAKQGLTVPYPSPREGKKVAEDAPATLVGGEGVDDVNNNELLPPTHPLFRVVKALLLLCGYADRGLKNWEEMEDLVCSEYFFKRLQRFYPEKMNGEWRRLRASRAALVLKDLKVDELHSYPLVATMLYEYVKSVADLHGVAGGDAKDVVLTSSAGDDAVGEGTIKVDVKGGNNVMTDTSDQPSDVLELFPALDTAPLPEALQNEEICLRVSWTNFEKPAPPPVVEEEKKEGEEEKEKGSDDEDEEKDSDDEDEKDSDDEEEEDKDSDDEDKASDDEEEKKPAEPVDTTPWNPDLDVNAVLFDADGNALDCVYFNQLHSREGSVRLYELNKKVKVEPPKPVKPMKGKKGKMVAPPPVEPVKEQEVLNEQRLEIDLSRLPPVVNSISFGITAPLPNDDFSKVDRINCSLFGKKAGEAAGGMKFMVPGETDSHNILLGMLYRDPSNPRVWIISGIGEPVPRASTHWGKNFMQSLPLTLSYMDEFDIGNYDAVEPISVENPYDLKPGESFPLLGEDIVIGLGWTTSKPVDVDASVLVYDGEENVDSVHFNNLVSEDGSITHQGDNQSGISQGDNEKITLNLAEAGKSTSAMIVCVAIYDDESSFADVDDAYVRLFDQESQRELCRFRIEPHKAGNEDMLESSSQIMCKIYRTAMGWRLIAIGVPDEATTYEGLIEPAAPFASPNWGPAVQLRPGVPCSIADDEIMMGLGWTTKSGIDLDASVVIYEGDQQTDVVHFQKLKSNDRAIVHQGDNQDGEDDGDNEKVNVNLAKVSRNVTALVFIVCVYEETASFADVESAYVRLVSQDSGKEVARFTAVPESRKTSTCQILCKIARPSSDADWQLVPIGAPSMGRTYNEVVPVLGEYIQPSWTSSRTLAVGEQALLMANDVALGFGWVDKDDLDVDLEAYCFEGKTLVSVTSAGKPKTADGGLEHSGDNSKVPVVCDKEFINMHTAKVASRITSIVFALGTKNAKDNFSAVDELFVRAVDLESNGELAVLSFNPSEITSKTGNAGNFSVLWKLERRGTSFSIQAVASLETAASADERAKLAAGYVAVPKPPVKGIKKRVAKEAARKEKAKARKARLAEEAERLAAIKAAKAAEEEEDSDEE